MSPEGAGQAKMREVDLLISQWRAQRVCLRPTHDSETMMTAMMSYAMAMYSETLATALARASTARAVSPAQGQTRETSS